MAILELNFFMCPGMVGDLISMCLPGAPRLADDGIPDEFRYDLWWVFHQNHQNSSGLPWSILIFFCWASSRIWYQLSSSLLLHCRARHVPSVASVYAAAWQMSEMWAGNWSEVHRNPAMIQIQIYTYIYIRIYIHTYIYISHTYIIYNYITLSHTYIYII